MLLDKKAQAVIGMACPNEIIRGCGQVKSAKELWDTLTVMFEGTADVKANKVQLLVQQYEAFAHIPGENLDKKYERFNCLINELRANNKTYSNEDILNKFMRSLPIEWNIIRTVLRKVPDFNTYTLARLYGELRTYQLELEQDKVLEKGSLKDVGQFTAAFVTPGGTSSSSGSSSHSIPTSSDCQNDENTEIFSDFDASQVDPEDLEEAELATAMAFISMRVKNFWKRTGRKPGQPGTVKKLVNSFDKLKARCFNCNKLGHFAAECRAPKNNNQAQARGNRNFGQSFKPPQPQIQNNQPQKSFFTGDAEWSFTDDDGETYALMAHTEEVSTFNLLSECTSSTCVDKIAHLTMTVQNFQACLEHHKKQCSPHEFEIQELKEKLMKQQEEIDRLLAENENLSVNNRILITDKRILQDAIEKVNSELNDKKALVDKWNKSSNDFQKMLSQ